jgi:hypothetical protein
MTRGRKKLASIDVWEDGTVDVYVGTFPGSDGLTNADWQWIWPIRTEVKAKFGSMMKEMHKRE